MTDTFSSRVGQPRRAWRGMAVLGFVAGTTASAAIVVWYDIAQVAAAVIAGAAALPAAVLIHLVQLLLSALAWRALIAGADPAASTVFEARWIREAVNSLLPVASVGGGIAGARLLARAGPTGGAAAASLVVDVTLEAVTQLLFVACGAIVAWVFTSHDGSFAPRWLWVGFAVATAVIAGFLAAQRLGLLKMVEALTRRLNPAWLSGGQGEMHAALLTIYGRRPALLIAAGWHALSWALGALEVWVLSWGIGHPVSAAAALCIESLGVTVRTAAFLIPSGLAAQEAGFIVVGALFGMPPSIALAISMLKRARELIIGIPAIVRWQWLEGRALSPPRRTPDPA